MTRFVVARLVGVQLAAVVAALSLASPASAGGCSSFSISIGSGWGGGYGYARYGYGRHGYSSGCWTRPTYSCAPTYVYYDHCPPVVCRPRYCDYDYSPRYRSGYSIGFSYYGSYSDRSRSYSRDDWSDRDDRGVYAADASGVRTYRNDDTRAITDSRAAYRDWQAEVARPAAAPTVVTNAAQAAPARETSSIAAATPERQSARGATVDPPIAAPKAAPIAETSADAWVLLESGEFERASRLFGAKAAADKADAPSRVGYALAAAALGQHDTAAWALRRAFAADAEAVGFIPLGAAMSARLEALASGVREAAEAGRGPDRWFLLASIEYLRHRTEDSAGALRRAVALGESHAGAMKLAELVSGPVANAGGVAP